MTSLERDSLKRAMMWIVILGVAALLFYELRGILLPFVVGMLIAYALDPAADTLEERGYSRTIATVMITGMFFITLGIATALLLPALLHQLTEAASNIPVWINTLQSEVLPRWRHWLSRFDNDQAKALQSAAVSASGGLTQYVSGLMSGLFQSGLALLNIISLLLITPLVTFYLLRDWDGVLAKINSLLPLPYAETMREQAREVNHTLAAFVRGQLNVCVVLGGYYSLAFTLVGLPYGLVLGVMTGLLTFVPFLGFAASCIVGMTVAWTHYQFEQEFWMVAGIYLIGQALESYFLTPRLVGNRVGLHPLWVIFGMLAGGALFGLVGVLVAVPLTAVIGVLIRFAIARYLESGLYSGT